MANFSKISVMPRIPDVLSAPDIAGLSLNGAITSREMIANRRFPLALWRHELRPGATIRLEKPAEDHLFWVVSGTITIGATELGPEGVISIGRHAVAEVSGRGEVMHYVGHAQTRPDKPGGCVHVLSQGWMEHSPISHHTLYLDSSCPTCSVWLHRTHARAGKTTPLHRHTEAEIICIVEGTMLAGPKEIATGGAIGVGKDVVYGFRAGDQGLTFINFRQADPKYVPQEPRHAVPASERVLMRDLLGRLKAERIQAATGKAHAALRAPA